VQIAADILIHRSESDQAVNFDIYAFEWHFSIKNYAYRENCDMRAKPNLIRFIFVQQRRGRVANALAVHPRDPGLNLSPNTNIFSCFVCVAYKFKYVGCTLLSIICCQIFMWKIDSTHPVWKKQAYGHVNNI
jgi:hypothetical protein